ncbi:MAG TPA: phosphate signaling complex protein PhoU [Caulobacteraceae bacterium]|jgi:phosphate transport system protein|nr:phosphate signaling complex protein PhoU [Caulobacteraceae bacterium]
MTEQWVKASGDLVEPLVAEVARLGGLAEAQIADCLDAITRRDVALAHAVVARDPKLDALQADIERRAIELIATRQPVGRELRRTVAALKIAMNLERCGDLARNIAKRSLILSESEPLTALTRSVDRLGRLVGARLKEVLDAYTAGEIEKAANVWARDEEVDEHYNSLFRELLTYMMGDPRTITPGAHLLFIAKNLERVGDHATNIAEIIHFEITGEEMTGERPKWDALQRRPEILEGPLAATPVKPIKREN